MITIENPVEDDKMKRLEITGHPKIFAKLEDAEDCERQKFGIVKSLETLIKNLLKLSTGSLAEKKRFYFIRSESGVLVNFEHPAFFLDGNEFRLEPRVSKVGEIRAFSWPAKMDHEGFALSNSNYEYARYDLKIQPSIYEVGAGILGALPDSPFRFIHDEFTRKIIQSKKLPSIFAPPTVSTERMEFTKKLLSLLRSEAVVGDHMERWLLAFYSNNYLSGDVKDFLANLAFMRAKNEAALARENDSVWNAIFGWIQREIGLEAIAKKKTTILNKFFAQPCSHFKTREGLTPQGDYFVCEHGNRIMCQHETIVSFDELFSQYAERLPSGNTICRICGAELDRNPDFVGLISGFTKIDETKKYIYSRALSVVAQIEFSMVVSQEFISKFAGSITETVDTSVRQYFYDLEKLKGVTPDILGALKEIITVVHVHAALLILIRKNPAAVRYRKLSEFDAIKRAMIGDLLKSLSLQLTRVKIFKALNLDNVFTTILEKLAGSPPKIPKETHRFNPKDSILFRYFGEGRFHPYSTTRVDPEALLKLSESVTIPTDNFHQYVDAIIFQITRQPPFIGTQRDGVLILSRGFEEWKKFVAGIDALAHKYLTGKCILRFFSRELTREGQIAGPYEHHIPFDAELDYIGYIWGDKNGFHKHIWSSATVDGATIPLSQVPLDRHTSSILCAVCGAQKKTQKGLEKLLIEWTLKLSKRNFFKNYCKAKSVLFEHELVNGICSRCGYGSEEFLERVSLPPRSFKFVEKSSAQVEYEKFSEKVPQELPKYVGTLAKESYNNFWRTFGQYEDVTYKNLLAGKEGDKLIAISKIIFHLNSMNTFIGRVINVSRYPHKALEGFYAEYASGLPPLAKAIAEYLHSLSRMFLEAEHYEEIRKKFIHFFNLLPQKMQEYWGRELIRIVERRALSEDSVKAAALIAYKMKNTEGDTEEIGEKKDAYDGMDYDGHND